MMKLFLLLALAIGIVVFGYFDQQKRAVVVAESAVAIQKLEVAETERDSARDDLKQLQITLRDRTDYITNVEEAKTKELAELQTKLEESMKQVTQSTADDAKKQSTELEEVKTKLAAAEAALTQAKNEAATTQAQLTASRAEVQHLQQAQTRPTLGGAMERKR